MPTYEYKCDACGHEFEKFQSITAGPIRKCPKCGKLKVQRKISAGAGLIFKGSGFYITDYRSDSYKKDAKGDSSSSSGSESKPADAKTTAESKPAESKPAETPAPAKPAATETPKTKPKATKEKS